MALADDIRQVGHQIREARNKSRVRPPAPDGRRDWGAEARRIQAEITELMRMYDEAQGEPALERDLDPRFCSERAGPDSDKVGRLRRVLHLLVEEL